MHSAGTVPRALASLERMPIVLSCFRATRQSVPGRGAGPRRADRAQHTADAVQRFDSGLAH